MSNLGVGIEKRRLFSFEVEDVLALRPPHTLLEVLLPHGGPGPAVQILDAIADLRARYQRRRPAVDDEERLIAVRQVVWCHVVELALSREEPHVSDRLYQRFFVIEDSFVLEPEERALRIRPRRPNLDRLQFVRILPAGMGEPS